MLSHRPPAGLRESACRRWIPQSGAWTGSLVSERWTEFLRNRFRWVLIGWMFAISAIAYLDRVNISIAGHAIQQEFGLDNIRLGWVFSAFVAGYALFQAPGFLLPGEVRYFRLTPHAAQPLFRRSVGD